MDFYDVLNAEDESKLKYIIENKENSIELINIKSTIERIKDDSLKIIALKECENKLGMNYIKTIIKDLRQDKLKMVAIEQFKCLQINDMIEILKTVDSINSAIKKEFIMKRKSEIRLEELIELIKDMNKDEKKEMIDIYMKNYYEPKTYNTDKIGLPERMTIGIELEYEKIFYHTLIEMQQTEIFSYVCEKMGIPNKDVKRMLKWNIKREISVKKGGEITSPELIDNVENWKALCNICKVLKSLGAEATSRCGGHIHIGANILGCDNEIWETLLNLWGEIEEIIYKITSPESTREAVTIHAQPIHKTIEKIRKKGSINIESEEDLDELVNIFRDEHSRNGSMNLTNVNGFQKNTIEFRLANGSLDYDVIRQNIKLYGKIIETVINVAKNPEYKRTEYREIFNREVNEEKKLSNTLDLLFDSNEEKEVYKRRWKNVHNSEIYNKLFPDKHNYR